MSQIEISPDDTARRLEAGEIQLVDVREDHEWEAGRIAGARHIELAGLTEQAATIDKDKPVVFQCLAGSRSLMAAQAFRNAGYDAYSMAGGLGAWAAAGLPLEPEDGYVASH